MKLVRLVLAAALLIAAAIAANYALHGRPVHALGELLSPHAPVQPGQPFPVLGFESLDGSAVTFEPATGHVTFVNVFATWCTPCRGETPDLVAFAKSGAGRGVDVVGIDQQETPSAVDAFRAQFRATYPMVIDTGRITKDLLGARIIPHTLVLDRTGVVRAVVSGPMTRAQMDQLAAAAASGS